MPRKTASRAGRRNPLSLFAEAARTRAERHAPLAARMRPRTLEEFVGQEHLVGEGRVLRRAIDADELPSMVFWGPPGSGKTTLARIIASLTQSHFELVSAVASGVADLRRVVAEASERLGEQGSAQFCSSTRSIASTRRSKMSFFLMSRTARSHSLAPRRRTHRSK